MSLSPGQAFGNYRILSRIGVGGMGMVFLAEHPHIGKRVALKIIHRDLAGNREVVNRFLNEARAVNQIGSEHIVQIHDFGQTDDGEHFFIMEYLDGRTLAHELAGGALEMPRALHIGAQIASALVAAHDASIIHRDLKPDNVMLIHRLGDPDFVKLLDFGLAKFLSSADARKLTAAGVVLGTPHYMSPEACESKPDVDARCDIYSLGVLLFQMLTGELPFTGESMGEVLVKQVAQPPPAPRGINPQVPPAVEQVVLRCLAKSPEARFQSMRELREAMLDPAGYLAGSPPVVPVAATAAAATLYGGPGPRRGRFALPAPSEPERRAAAPTGIAGPADRPTELALAPEPARGAAELGARPGSPSDAPTRYMDEAAHRRFGGPLPASLPRPVENRTMEIGTPHGYSTSSPRRTWPLGVAVVVAGAAAGAAALWVVRPDLLGGGGRERAAAATPAAGGESEVRMARIRLTTRPSGADIIDAAGNRVGTTPIDIALPIDGHEVLLRFHHPQAAESEKRFIPSGDMAFDIELPPAPVVPPPVVPAPASAEAETRDSRPPAVREPPPAPEKRRPRRQRKVRRDLLRPDF